jgi:hypothetical protein
MKRLKTLIRALLYTIAMAGFFIALLGLTVSFRYSGGPT